MSRAGGEAWFGLETCWRNGRSHLGFSHTLFDPARNGEARPGATNAREERPEALVLQRVAIRSADSKTTELRNPQTSTKGIKVELVPKEAGKAYELVARLNQVPASTVSGNVSFETSVAAQSRIEVPVIVNVFRP